MKKIQTNEQVIKKIYMAPQIEKIEIDTEISLVMMSTMPMEPGGDPGIVSINKFNKILRG